MGSSYAVVTALISFMGCFQREHLYICIVPECDHLYFELEPFHCRLKTLHQLSHELTRHLICQNHKDLKQAYF